MRSWLCWGAGALTGCMDTSIVKESYPRMPPIVSMLTPQEGDVVPTSFLAEAAVASEDDAVEDLSIEWAVDGVLVCADAVVDSSGFSRCAIALTGTTAVLSATVTDSVGARARDDVSVRVAADENHPPDAPVLALTPAYPTSADDLFVEVAPVTDPDGDPVTVSLRWFRDGVEVGGLTEATVPAAETVRYEEWRVEAWANDGTVDGPIAVAGPVTIVNAPPTGGEVAIGPVDPEAGSDDLLCAVLSAPTDPDGDDVSLSVAWWVDGVPWTGAVGSVTLPGDQVFGADTTAESVWRCEVTPDDGVVDGAPMVAEVSPQTCATYRARDTPFVYGTLLDSRTGRSYRTIQIGDQHWMADNLDIGTRVDGVDPLLDNSVMEKWCAGDDDAWCVTYGGIYNRSEAIDYAPIEVEAVQGICPSGWHVPTVAEFDVLVAAAGTSRGLVDVCEGDRSGTDTVGFAAQLAGTRSWGHFERQGTMAKFWTSTDRGSGGYSYNLVVTLTDTTVPNLWETGANAGENGFSIRCIEDP